MRTKNMIGLFLRLITLGFVAGIGFWLYQIIANRYIHYGMFRLIALSLQKCVNTAVPVFVTVFFVLYVLWFITTKTLKLPEKRVAQLALTAVVVLVLLCMDRLFRNFTGYSPLSAFKGLVGLTARLLAGKASWGFFFSLANKYIAVIIVSLIGTVTIGLCLFILPGRILRVNWQSLFAGKKPGRIQKTTLVIVLLAIINLCIVVDRMIIEPKGPNIILISIDTLRADRLGCYGYTRDTSPNIDSFSKDAVRFTKAIAPRSKTTPSMVSIFTGLYPHTHGVRKLYKPLKKRVLTLAEILRNKNYKTCAIVGNWVLTGKHSGLDQGIDTYDDKITEMELNRDIPEKRAPAINEAAFKWLDKNHNKKFFLWLHYQDVHGPYVAPQEYRDLFAHSGQDLIPKTNIGAYLWLPWIQEKDGYVDADSYRDAYDAEIRFCDEYIGRLLKKLKDLGLTDNIIIIVADHGESLGEHDYYFAHGQYVYDQCANVPLLIHAPSLKVPKTIEKQVNIMNITPTILDILGFSIPSGTEGASLLPLIENEVSAGDEYIFIEKMNTIKAVRTDKWKYIKDLVKNSEELYNIVKDVSEESNVASENSGIVKKLKNVLAGWLNDNDSIMIQELSEMRLRLSEEDEKALRSLGYLE